MDFTQKKFNFDTIKYAVIQFLLCCLIFLMVAFTSQRINFLLSLSELHPERSLFSIFGIILGFPGIFGCLVANEIYLISSGISLSGSLLAIPLNFLSGFLPFILWKLFTRKDSWCNTCRFRISSLRRLLVYLFVTLVITAINSGFTGIYEAFFEQSVFFSIETTIAFMNGMIFTFFPGLVIIIGGSYLNHVDKIRMNGKTEHHELSIFENFILIFSSFSVLIFIVIGIKEYIVYSQIVSNSIDLSTKICVNLMILLVSLLVFLIVSSIFFEYRVLPETPETLSPLDSGETSASEGGKTGYSDKPEDYKGLVFAKQIKNVLLPQLFPTFTPCTDVDIFASIKFSKDFGGDFYDFFLVDETHLAIMIADVTGRGVEAALFLSIAKNLIKDKIQAGFLPEETFSDINLQLCKDNSAGLFVSVWIGLLNTETGELNYINAGQPYPILMRNNQPCKILESAVDLALGVSDETLYSSNTITLEKNDKLALYTRGVTEVENPEKESYGQERLCAFLNKYKEIEVQEIVEGLIREIAIYSATSDPQNDMTVLALEYKKS